MNKQDEITINISSQRSRPVFVDSTFFTRDVNSGKKIINILIEGRRPNLRDASSIKFLFHYESVNKTKIIDGSSINITGQNRLELIMPSDFTQVNSDVTVYIYLDFPDRSFDAGAFVTRFKTSKIDEEMHEIERVYVQSIEELLTSIRKEVDEVLDYLGNLEAIVGPAGPQGEVGPPGVVDEEFLHFLIGQTIDNIELPEGMTEQQVLDIVSQALADQQTPDGGVTPAFVNQAIQEAVATLVTQHTFEAQIETIKAMIQDISLTPGPQGIQGEPGRDGVNGEMGPQGLPGRDGANGIDGIQGETGAQGIQGVQGDIGPTGPQGEPGPTANIEHLEQQLNGHSLWSGTQAEFDALTPDSMTIYMVVD